MEKIFAFLRENPTFYCATVDGSMPRVRPLGFVMEYQGKLYLGIGKHKAAYRQLQANPNLELCTADKTGRWIRIRGVASFDESPEALAKAFEVMPDLKALYNEQTKAVLGMIWISEGEAEFADMKGNFESFKF